MRLHFLWHMHQPMYVEDGVITMPWVFLHSIKDYYDMPYMVDKCDVKVTFNITPTLIQQIKMYEEDLFQDKFLTLWYKNPKDLKVEDKKYILKIIKSTNETIMIDDEFKELLRFDVFSDEEFINLEVSFILSWCGVFLKEKLKDFIAKKFYKQEDKEYLLSVLKEFIKTILPFYRKLQEDGKISIFTTPYTHPILPLLLDMNNAKEAKPQTSLPKEYLCLEDDAVLHIQKAKEIYKDTFGIDAKGFWPAEGAVDEKSLKLYVENGLKYIATDEVILYKSGESDHNQPYTKDKIMIFFRDHSLSDLVGFKCRFLSTDDALNDFHSKLNPNASLISVILDGENAWEFYPGGGYDFLEKLYESLKSYMVRADDIEIDECKSLEKLSPGSWINGNFDTWVGDSEKNLAWEYLYRTKKDYLKSDVKNKEIQEKFLNAECSDWFWWYGEGHFTSFSIEFDELFRRHLINIYKLMKKEIPQEILFPIVKEKIVSYHTKPKNRISPSINGKFNSIFDWYGAGMIDESKIFTTMGTKRLIEKIYYGMDEENFYFAFYGDIKKIDDFYILIDENGKKIKLDKNCTCNDIVVKSDTVLELKISKDIVDLKKFHIKFDFGEEIVPSFGGLLLEKEMDFSDNWFV